MAVTADESRCDIGQPPAAIVFTILLKPVRVRSDGGTSVGPRGHELVAENQGLSQFIAFDHPVGCTQAIEIMRRWPLIGVGLESEDMTIYEALGLRDNTGQAAGVRVDRSHGSEHFSGEDLEPRLRIAPGIRRQPGLDTGLREERFPVPFRLNRYLRQEDTGLVTARDQ